MNVSEQARRAYAPTHVQIHTPRSIESKLLSEITSDLRNSKGGDFQSVVAAIHRNRDLWTTLASGVADSSNELPESLRAQIFYLAEFTDVHSREVLRGSADIDALIDINTAILRGLNHNGDR